MEPDRPHNPAPPPPAAPLDYRRGGGEQKSQWWTDEHAYGAAMVYALLGLTFLGGIIGALWWVVSWAFGFWFGW